MPLLPTQGGTKKLSGVLLPLTTPSLDWVVRPAQGKQITCKDLDSHYGASDTQEFSGGTDSCWWGWGAGRGRGKYIFKDNLEANIIFILIYPQSSLARPQTCLMSRNCKMATNPTCLPLHSL